GADGPETEADAAPGLSPAPTTNGGSPHVCIISAMLAKLMGYFLLGLIRVLTGSQARWYGCPPKAEQRIYFANHQSHADLLLVWAALPQDLRALMRPIAARDYWTKTPFRQWITTEVFN